MLERCTSVSHCEWWQYHNFKVKGGSDGRVQNKVSVCSEGVQGCLVGTEEQETPLGGHRGPCNQKGLGLDSWWARLPWPRPARGLPPGNPGKPSHGPLSNHIKAA